MPNVKPKTIKLLEENFRENLHDLKSSKDFLATTQKVWSIKEKKLIRPSKLKISAHWKKNEEEDKPQTGRKYLQNINLIKDLYLYI